MHTASFLSSALWISHCMISSCTNLSTFKLDTHSSLQNLIHFPRTLLIFLSVIASMNIWCHWMFWKFRLFFFEFGDQPIPKTPERSVSFFSVGLPRTVCAFVSLTRDNMIKQYINTLLETPRPNVIQTACYCSFEKFRIKRYPNRPSLDYPLDLTKSTNHKIRKRKWT